MGKKKAPNPMGRWLNFNTYHNRKVQSGTNYRCSAKAGGVQSTHSFDKIMEMSCRVINWLTSYFFLSEIYTRSNSARYSVA